MTICQGERPHDDTAGSHSNVQIPDTGQIVAVVAGNSKPKDPKILLAKVFSYKQGEAQLHHMEKVEGTDNLYRPSIGTNSAWYESIETLIWPIHLMETTGDTDYTIQIKKLHSKRCRRLNNWLFFLSNPFLPACTSVTMSSCLTAIQFFQEYNLSITITSHKRHCCLLNAKVALL